MHTTPRYAVIDIGTNAVRLQIGKLLQHTIVTELFTRVPLGLGGSSYSGTKPHISAAASRRLVSTISGMRHLIASMKPCPYRAVATAAVRDASNRQQLITLIKQQCKVHITVLSGNQEAAIIGTYAASHFSAPVILNTDIGGGSTDCALIINGNQAAAATFAIGTARSSGGTAAEKTRCRRWLQTHTPPSALLCASGGSALQLQQCCGTLTPRRLANWHKAIQHLSVADLSRQYQMTPDRAAHVKDAIDIYRLILSSTAAKQIYPVRGGLSEALIWHKLTRQAP